MPCIIANLHNYTFAFMQIFIFAVLHFCIITCLHFWKISHLHLCLFTITHVCIFAKIHSRTFAHLHPWLIYSGLFDQGDGGEGSSLFRRWPIGRGTLRKSFSKAPPVGSVPCERNIKHFQINSLCSSSRNIHSM